VSRDDHAFPHLPAEAWQRLLADELDGPAERRLLDHAAGCEACRRALEDADPSRLFSRVRALAVRADVFDGFWEELAPELGPRPSRAAENARRGRVGLLAGAAAAAVVLAALLLAPDLAPPPPARVAADPCPPSHARLALTADECRALFGSPHDAALPPVLIVNPDLDLRGL
jgi:hypothetical protein